MLSFKQFGQKALGQNDKTILASGSQPDSSVMKSQGKGWLQFLLQSPAHLCQASVSDQGECVVNHVVFRCRVDLITALPQY